MVAGIQWVETPGRGAKRLAQSRKSLTMVAGIQWVETPGDKGIQFSRGCLTMVAGIQWVETNID